MSEDLPPCPLDRRWRMRVMDEDGNPLDENGNEWIRADGDCLCSLCGKEYWRHPHAKEFPGLDGRLWLRRICTGRLVKL